MLVVAAREIRERRQKTRRRGGFLPLTGVVGGRKPSVPPGLPAL